MSERPPVGGGTSAGPSGSVDASGPSGSVGASPFKFLDSYEKGDKDRFFGRSRETGQLFNAVHASNLVLVYGGSGTGKTSLIQCGLGNQFEDSDWLPLFVRRGDDLVGSLDREVTRSLNGSGPGAGATLSEKIRALYLDHYRPIYLIFDQFEELYILGRRAEQDQFHRLLGELLGADLKCKILLVIREEYIAYLSDLEKIVPSLFDNRLRIEAMTEANLRRVVAGTTRSAGIRVERPRETIPKIIDFVRDRREGVDLTNLQVYLDRLWHTERESARTDDVTFDLELVERVGLIDRVLALFLDEQIGLLEDKLSKRGVSAPQGIPLEILFTMVTEEGTKRSLEAATILEGLPKNRQISEADVSFCIDEFVRIKLLRSLAVD